MGDSVRLVEILGTLSLATDAADGFPPETTIRSALLAAQLAADLGDDALVRDVIVGALLRHIGCTGFAVEEAHRYGAGDDVGLRHVMAEVDFGQPARAAQTITEQLAADAEPTARQAAVGALLGDGPAAGARHDAAQCDAAEHLCALLPIGSGPRAVASDAFERWDGSGGPAGKSGAEISLVARVVEVAYVAELFRGRQGRGGATAELQLRSGSQLDPTIVDAFGARRGELFDHVDATRHPTWELLLDAEPRPHRIVPMTSLDAFALAFARFTDLKSTWFAGHSEAVAEVAAAAAGALGLDAQAIARLRWAGLLHDLGRVAVPTGTWDVPRPLSSPERDRVRFHSWETQRILEATPLLADVAPIAGGAHERSDGSGYHRGLQGPALDPSTKLLAAADVITALAEPRPHRPAHDDAGAQAEIRAEVDARRLDRDAVAAVLDVTGRGRLAAPRWPDQLTDREVDVLRLVATGASNKDVARALGIRAKTVAHHVAHVYDKTACRSRAGATLYALAHGLIGATSSLPPPGGG